MYRRYNTVQHNTPQKPAAAGQRTADNPFDTPKRAGPAPRPQPSPQHSKPAQQPKEPTKPSHTDLSPRKEPPRQKDSAKPPYGALLGLIPRHIYNPDTKKILGFLSSEDLLLIALIFLFLESSEEDNPMMVLALVYVLLGEYIDFGDFAI